MTDQPKIRRPKNATRPKKKHPDDHTPGIVSSYTKERGDYVCEIVATHAIGLEKLHKMYKDDGFPDQETILRWRRSFPEFGTQFVEAKAFQAMVYVEEIYDISDDATRDLIETDKGAIPNSSAIARAKLQVETRKWVVARLLPKLYGDRSYVENNVSIKHEDALSELE